MTTGGQMNNLVEKLENFAKTGNYGLKTRAWLKDVQKLEKEGLQVQIIAHLRPGEISCFIDWSHCGVDVDTYSSSDPSMTRGNRLWLMTYKANHPELKINI